MILSKEYKEWLTKLKAKICQAQIKASVQVNEEMLRLYWDIGHDFAVLRMDAKWGSGFFVQLSRDLKRTFPDMKGFSVQNLRFIKRFYLFYSNELEIRQQPVSEMVVPQNTVKDLHSATPLMETVESARKRQITSKKYVKVQNQSISQQPVSEMTISENIQKHLSDNLPSLIFRIPWGHHITLMTKCKTVDEALFYGNKIIEGNWSRSVLLNVLDTGLYEASGKAITNFSETLPVPQGDLAQQTLKNPYTFDFLTMRTGFDERELEDALTENITHFLLELGTGFSYVGRQIRIEVGGKEFFIDLLFYHLKLRCFVVVELKTVAFDPSHLGQLNFYVTAVNEQLRHPTDAETIGLLICKEKNKIVAEYALKGTNMPLGISEYQLSRLLPEEVKSSLPSIEEIEAELAVPSQKEKI